MTNSMIVVNPWVKRTWSWLSVAASGAPPRYLSFPPVWFPRGRSRQRPPSPGGEAAEVRLPRR